MLVPFLTYPMPLFKLFLCNAHFKSFKVIRLLSITITVLDCSPQRSTPTTLTHRLSRARWRFSGTSSRRSPLRGPNHKTTTTKDSRPPPRPTHFSFNHRVSSLMLMASRLVSLSRQRRTTSQIAFQMNFQSL